MREISLLIIIALVGFIGSQIDNGDSFATNPILWWAFGAIFLVAIFLFLTGRVRFGPRRPRPRSRMRR